MYIICAYYSCCKELNFFSLGPKYVQIIAYSITTRNQPKYHHFFFFFVGFECCQFFALCVAFSFICAYYSWCKQLSFLSLGPEYVQIIACPMTTRNQPKYHHFFFFFVGFECCRFLALCVTLSFVCVYYSCCKQLSFFSLGPKYVQIITCSISTHNQPKYHHFLYFFSGLNAATSLLSA